MTSFFNKRKYKYQPGGNSDIGIPVSHKNIQGTILPVKDDIPYTNLPEITITAQAPHWLKYQKEYETKYPFNKSAYGNNEFILKFNPEKKQGLLNLYNKKRDEYAGKKLLKIKPNIYGYDRDSRLKWYNAFSPRELEVLENADLPEFRKAQRTNLEYQSNQAKKYTIGELFNNPEKLSQSVSGTGERFRLFPNANSNIESWINPLMMIGDMATGLGNVPLNIKNKNYGSALLGAASPVLTGALGTIGSNSTGQWLKNTVLPIGGAEIDIPIYVYNNVKNGLKQSKYVKALNPFYKKNTNKKLEAILQQEESISKDLKTIEHDKHNRQESIRDINSAIDDLAEHRAARYMVKKYPDFYNNHYQFYSKRKADPLSFFGDKQTTKYNRQKNARTFYINSAEENSKHGFYVHNNDLYRTMSLPDDPIFIFQKTGSVKIANKENILDLQTKQAVPFHISGVPLPETRIYPSPKSKSYEIIPYAIDPMQKASDNIVLNPEYVNTLKRNIDYVLSLFPGSKNYGSSSLVTGVNMPHFTNDVDLKITQKDFEKIKDKYPKIMDIKYGHKYSIDPELGELGYVDVNIIRENWKGNATGQLAEDMYRKLYPDKYYELQERAIKSGKKEGNEFTLDLDVTPEQLLKEYDPEIMSIVDAYEAGVNPEKQKHINRIDVLMNYGDADKVLKGQEVFVKSLMGSKGDVGKQFTTEQLSNIEKNKKILKDIEFVGDIDKVAKDPKKMQIALNDYYINNSIISRLVSTDSLIGFSPINKYNTIIDAYMTWKGKGGNGMGDGLNAVLLGNPSIDGANIRGHKQFKLYDDNITTIDDYIYSIKRKMHGDYEFTDDEIKTINQLRQKYNISTEPEIKKTEDLLNRDKRLFEINSDPKKLSTYQKFLKEVGEKLDIRGIKSGEYGNSYYVTDLGYFTPNDHLNLMLNKSYRPVKSRKQRLTHFNQSKNYINPYNERDIYPTLSKDNYYRIKSSFDKQIQDIIKERKEKFNYKDMLDKKRIELLDRLNTKRYEEHASVKTEYKNRSLVRKANEILQLEKELNNYTATISKLEKEIANLDINKSKLYNELDKVNDLQTIYSMFAAVALPVGLPMGFAILNQKYNNAPRDLYSGFNDFKQEKEFLDNVDINQMSWNNKNKEEIFEKIKAKYNSDAYKLAKKYKDSKLVNTINWSVYNNPAYKTPKEYVKYLNDIEKYVIRKHKRNKNQ